MSNFVYTQGQDQSVVKVTLCYLGINFDARQVASKKRCKRKTHSKKKGGTVRRELDLAPTEVVVQQQARGYTPIQVYKGHLRPGGKRNVIAIKLL